MTKEQKEAKKRTDELIDELLAERGLSPEAVLGKGGLVSELTKRVSISGFGGITPVELKRRAVKFLARNSA